MNIGIIGTAGRQSVYPMGRELWDWMLNDARKRVHRADHLVSGGAAWADHLAVALFLEGRVSGLTLHLPAPLEDRFIGPPKSAGSVANYYHYRFKQMTGIDGLADIVVAAQLPNCDGTFEPAAPGYGAMFARNSKIAQAAETLFAYTFAKDDLSITGGTKDTWDKCKGQRIHISLLNR